MLGPTSKCKWSSTVLTHLPPTETVASCRDNVPFPPALIVLLLFYGFIKSTFYFKTSSQLILSKCMSQPAQWQNFDPNGELVKIGVGFFFLL